MSHKSLCTLFATIVTLFRGCELHTKTNQMCRLYMQVRIPKHSKLCVLNKEDLEYAEIRIGTKIIHFRIKLTLKEQNIKDETKSHTAI